jgi:hypothetical protein
MRNLPCMSFANRTCVSGSSSGQRPFQEWPGQLASVLPASDAMPVMSLARLRGSRSLSAVGQTTGLFGSPSSSTGTLAGRGTGMRKFTA